MLDQLAGRRTDHLAVDHLIYAVPDLHAGIAEVQKRLGATLSPGLQHELWGTRSALLSLGTRCFLEVIGPDPDAPTPRRKRPFTIDALTEPRLTTWCGAPVNLDIALGTLRSSGFDPGPPTEMSRRTPGGSLLTWRLTLPRDRLPGDGLLPLLIDWGTTPHPSASAPSHSRLIGMRAEHPEPARIRRTLEALNADLPVTSGPAPVLVAVIDTPGGRVELR